jgi:hypothetical protein
MHATGRIGYRFLGKQVTFSFARAPKRGNSGTSSASPSHSQFSQTDLHRDRAACAFGALAIGPVVAVSEGTKWSSVSSHNGRAAGIVIRLI